MDTANSSSLEQEKEHSKLGALSLLLGLAIIIHMSIALIFLFSTDLGSDPAVYAALSFYCLTPLLWLAALVLSILELVKKEKRKTLPILGIITCIVLIIPICISSAVLAYAIAY
jgi:hypothetical protein